MTRKAACWWFGCEHDPDDPAPVEYVTCIRCGESIDYADLVGDTRHNRTMEWLGYWFFRKWLPAQCVCCKRRFWHSDDCDGIPF